jgi:hypothetical protein
LFAKWILLVAEGKERRPVARKFLAAAWTAQILIILLQRSIATNTNLDAIVAYSRKPLLITLYTVGAIVAKQSTLVKNPLLKEPLLQSRRQNHKIDSS